MRIGANYSQNSVTEATNKATGAANGRRTAGPSAETPTSTGAVKVTWSAKALELDETHASESSEKVARLRSAVDSGQLDVDPDKIAAAIVGE